MYKVDVLYDMWKDGKKYTKNAIVEMKSSLFMDYDLADKIKEFEKADRVRVIYRRKAKNV